MGMRLAKRMAAGRRSCNPGELVKTGRTMGCFYIESPAMRLLQKKAGRGDFEHLVIHSSIIRPAANEFIREYLRRLHGGGWQPPAPAGRRTP